MEMVAISMQKCLKNKRPAKVLSPSRPLIRIAETPLRQEFG